MAQNQKEQRLNRKKIISIKRTKWILGIPSSAKDYRGLAAEAKGLCGLKYHKTKKTKFPGGWVIEEITPTMHFSRDDLEGKDAIVKFQSKFHLDSEILPVQFQNWWTLRAEDEYRGKGICLITIWPKEGEKEARKKTFDSLSKWLRNRRKKS